MVAKPTFVAGSEEKRGPFSRFTNQKCQLHIKGAFMNMEIRNACHKTPAVHRYLSYLVYNRHAFIHCSQTPYFNLPHLPTVTPILFPRFPPPPPVTPLVSQTITPLFPIEKKIIPECIHQTNLCHQAASRFWQP